jgi:hypothetical protein
MKFRTVIYNEELFQVANKNKLYVVSSGGRGIFAFV